MTGSLTTTAGLRADRADAGPRSGRQRAVAFVVSSMFLLAGLSACGVRTPLCDQGASLAEAAQLGPATEKYAQASLLGEGECAEAGLSASGTRYVDSYVNIARAKLAENVNDVEAATTAYRAALTFDTANVIALDGLDRLQQPRPVFSPPQPVPLPPPPSVGSPDRVVWGLSIAAVVLLCAVLALLSWLTVKWRGEVRVRDEREKSGSTQAGEAAKRGQATLERATKAVEYAKQAATHAEQAEIYAKQAEGHAQAIEDQQRTTSDRLDGIRVAVADLDSGLDPRLEQVAMAQREVNELWFAELSDARSAMLTAIDRVATRLEQAGVAPPAQRFTALERYLDEIVDYLGEALPDRTGPITDRFVRPGR